ncbi:unnamed protein product [Nyctereutes procyonoides]|uniref:(raccoon dog) hypothetical protein n=1 Tax=Nyctereutes procyonoides TaxID=34880 RepID=A0A811Y7B4_NYCPR|nr:unnamed protein product [Nyctereutes procyonoides]
MQSKWRHRQRKWLCPQSPGRARMEAGGGGAPVPLSHSQGHPTHPLLVCSHPWAGPPRGPNPLEPSRILAQLAHPLPRGSVERALLRVTAKARVRGIWLRSWDKETGGASGEARSAAARRTCAQQVEGGAPLLALLGPGGPGCSSSSSSSSEPPPEGSRRPRFSSSICEAALSHPHPVSQGQEPNIAPSYWWAERFAQVIFNSTHNCEAGTSCPSYKRRDRASEGTPPTAAPPPRELCSGPRRATGHLEQGRPGPRVGQHTCHRADGAERPGEGALLGK